MIFSSFPTQTITSIGNTSMRVLAGQRYNNQLRSCDNLAGSISPAVCMGTF